MHAHPPSRHPYCWKIWEDGAEVERRSVGIITVWRTRMDLYAISLAEHFANLLSTNGPVARATYVFFFFLVVFAAPLVTGRFLSPPDSPLTFSQFMRYHEKMESKACFFESASIWLPFSPILICLPAVCFVSCASSSIALTQSFNHASNLSTPRSQGGSFKIKIRILCRTATSKA